MALVAPPLGSAQLTVLHLHTYTWKINILNPKKITPFFPKENHLPNLQYCLVCSMFEISGVYGGNFYKKRVVCQTICGCPSTERQGFYFFCNEHFQSFLATHMFSLKMCFFGNKAFSPVLSWDLQIFHFFCPPHLFAWCLVVRKNSPKKCGDVPWWNLGSMVIPSCQFYPSIWPTV